VVKAGVSGASAGNGATIAQILTATGTTIGTATYIVTPTASGCAGTPVSVVITVNPSAQVNLTDLQVVCNETSTTAIIFSTNNTVGVTTYTWTNNQTDIGLAASGTGNIAPFTATNSGIAPLTATIAVTPHFANGAVTCDGTTMNFTITVNPTAKVNPPTSPVVCNQANAAVNFSTINSNGITIYNWTNSETSIGLVANGTGNIAPFIATNTGTAPVVATIVVIPSFNYGSKTCDGPPKTFTITVNPTPVLSSSLALTTICSGGIFSYTPTSLTSGTTFNWNRAAVAGISNLAASGSDNPNETLINLTDAAIEVKYSFTLNANGCSKNQDVRVSVLPAPVLLSSVSPSAVCNNSPFRYTPVSSILGTTMTWTRSVIAGISNPAGSGSGNIIETLINTTASDVVVPYVYTLTLGGCINSITVNATVKPTLELTSMLMPAAICSNTVFSYTATSATAGTTYQWTRATVSGISNPSGAGLSGVVSETLINTTASPIVVIYAFTLRASPCQNVQFVMVTVNPIPTLTSSPAPPAICTNSSFSYSPTSATAGTTFAWNRAVVAGISNPSASGNNNPNESLINTTTNPISVSYFYTLTANGCTNTQNVAVKVNPITVITVTPAAPIICNGTSVTLTASGASTYSWNPATGLSATTGTTVIASPTTTTTYTVTGTDINGCINSTTVLVTVLPKPNVSVSPASATICNGGNVILIASGAVTYSWSPATGLSATTGTTVTASPIITTIYTVTGTNASSCTNTATVTITVNPLPVITITPASASICEGASTSLTASGTSSYVWSPEDGLSATTGATVTASPSVTTTYTVTGTDVNNCVNTNSVVVSVNPLPTLTSLINPPNVCSSHPFSYSPTSSVLETTVNWNRATVAGISNPASSGTGDINEALLNTTLSSVLATYVYTLSANGCTTTASIQVWVVPAPPVTASASATPICSGTTFNLFSSTTVATQTISLLSETFNGPNTWLLGNASMPVVTRPAAAWQPRSSPYNPGNLISSNDATQFYLSDSRTQNGTITSTTLQSPLMDTRGYTTLSLNFWHYFRFVGGIANDSAKVQVSTNGTNWTTVATYTSTQVGSTTLFTNPTIPLNTYIGNPTLYVRFYYSSKARARYWAIDNVSVTGTVAPTISWTSNPSGFTSVIANPTNVTQVATTTYTATYSYPGFTCTGQASVTVANLVDVEPPVIHDMPDDVSFTCTDCIQAFKNADFEDNPTITTWDYVTSVPGNQGVRGWYTTAPKGQMEIQRSGCAPCGGALSYSGNYHAELNSNEVGDFYQQFCTVPTTTVQVSFQHKKRVPPVNTPPYTGPDVMGVYTGPDLAHLTLIYTASTTNQNAWTPNTVNVPIPPGQISTIFLFRAISTSSGDPTYGNLIDDIRAVTLFNPTQIPYATDNCSANINFTEQKIPGACSINYNLIRTWTAVDPSGNSTSATQTVKVGDFDAPVLTITPEFVTTDCAVPDLPTVTAIDNCAAPSEIAILYLGEVRTNGSCPNKYTLTRTWSATDLCSNKSLKTQVVTINDNIAPVITLPPTNLTLECFDAALVAAWTATASATDNCDGTANVTATYTVPVNSCSQPIIVTFTATDACNNTSSATKSFTVNDITAPVITTAANSLNATLQCSNTSGIAGALALVPTATDNCTAIPTIHLVSDVSTADINCTNAFVRVRTWNFTDACGNTSTSFVQTITVIDNTAPVITTIAGALDARLQCNNTAGLANSLAMVPAALDNCTLVSTIHLISDVTTPNATCPNAYVRIRTWNFTDGCGNTSSLYTQTITVEDTTSPTWTTPAGALNEYFECSNVTGIATAQALLPIATDYCDLTPVTTKITGVFVPSATCPQTGTYTNTFTAIDDCGNVSTVFTQTIYIEDNTAPDIIAPPTAVISCDEDPSNHSITGVATATDNCDSSVSITHSDLTPVILCAGTYQILRTWTATDGCGNFSTCQQTIFVQDVIPPVITCVVTSNQYVLVNSAGVYIHPDISWDAASSDNCSGVTLTASLTGATISGPFNSLSGATFIEGVTTVTWTSIDGCGNMSTCHFTVTAGHNLQITCPPNIYQNTNVGVCSATFDPGFPTKISGFEPITYTWVMSGSTTGSGIGAIGIYPFNSGITTINWQATNITGTATCSQTITVSDNEPPTFILPPPLSECVEIINTAIYNAVNMDINPDRPEYYTFVSGNSTLDLDPMSFNDNCPLSCVVEIRWKIDMNDGSRIPALPSPYQTGQPSTFGGDIHFLGDGLTFTNITHTITYWIVDCIGNISVPQTQIITIKPRPNITKVN